MHRGVDKIFYSEYLFIYTLLQPQSNFLTDDRIVKVPQFTFSYITLKKLQFDAVKIYVRDKTKIDGLVIIANAK